MKKVIIICTLLLTVAGFGQNDEAYVDDLTKEFTQKLVERNITEFFTVKRYCSGKIEMFQIGKERKMCTSKGTYYKVFVVWKEEDTVHVKKIDNCGLFYSIALTDTDIFDFFSQNRTDLASEKVKQYKSASYTGTPELRKQPQPCFRSFSFTEAENTAAVSYNLFDLSNEKDNLNFEHNNQRKVVMLDAKLDTILTTSEGSMRRQI
ncbi:MAG: hypothetical protein AAF489_15965 [Bacteroidota bacterium]